MPYTTEETVTPFWAEFSSAASGRDPLAVQNSSVVIYSKMVVGITNVTNRIRYNGFFCWIFDVILQNIDRRNSLQEQIRYNRRAELLLAYIMLDSYPDITGVSGRSYAEKNVNETINLSTGADWEFKQQGEKVYWQYSQGIFGQYYSGVTRVLNLINHPNPQLDLNVYTLNEKGKELAKAFGENISENEKTLFWQSVYNGSILKSDLDKLKSFALHLIPNTSKEHSLYKTVLLDADDRKVEPTFHRRETIKLLLAHLSDNSEGIENPVESFLRANYKLKSSEFPLQINTATAWYLYELNEIIHVAFEHFHSCFLYYIDSYPTSLENNINELVEATMDSFFQETQLEGITSIDQLKEQIKRGEEEVYKAYDEMEKSFKARQYGKCLMFAVRTLLRAYLNIEPHLMQLEQYASAPENNYNRIGYAVDLINELVRSHTNLSLSKYVKTILIKAINQHTFSSYNKTKIGQSLVHNYMIEDYSVWRLRETLPNRTSPRLQNMLQYISDLRWVDRKVKVYTLTDLGTNILRDI